MISSVLIVGGSGFVGHHLAFRLREEYRVFATYHARPMPIPGVSNLPLDMGNRGLVKRVLSTAKPEAIVYVAGPPSLPNGRKDPTLLEKLHAEGPANLLNFTEHSHSRLIYLSSPLVFDGARGNYRDTDPSLPNTLQGRAQISGENFIRGRMAPAVVIRCSPLFGRGNALHISMLDRIRMSLDRGRPIELNDYHLHSFAPVTGLVDVIAEVIAKPSIRAKTFHYGGLTKVTQSGFGRAFARRYGYDEKLIVPRGSTVTTEAARAAGRDIGMLQPGDFSLNSTATVEALKIKPLLLEEGLDLIEKQLVASL